MLHPVYIKKEAKNRDLTFRRSSTCANSSFTCCIFLFYNHM